MNIADIPKRAVTHAGTFHADDVFSAALLRMLRPDIEIERVTSVPDGFDGLAFDIGGGRFDHHMLPVPTRGNGQPLAAFGLLWAEFGRELLEGSERDWKAVDGFVARIDRADNTGEYNDVAALVAAMNPNWDEDLDPDECFERAVEWASVALARRIRSADAKRHARDEVAAIAGAQGPPVLVLDEYRPFYDVTVGSDFLYAVYPSHRGGWNVQAIPADLVKKEPVRPLPEAWRGKRGEELAAMTGVPSFSFCHASGFLAACGNRDDALAIAQLALAPDLWR